MPKNVHIKCPESIEGVKALADYKNIIKQLLFFNVPPKDETFILKERESEIKELQSEEEEQQPKKRREKGKIRKITNPCCDNNTGKEGNGGNGGEEDKQNQGAKSPTEVSKKLSDNLEYMKKIYSIPTNGDMVLREFDIVVKNEVIPAFMIFFDGMTDRKVINDNIMQPLMLLSNLDIKSDEQDVESFVKDHILPHCQLKVEKKYRSIIDEVNFGGCALFIDGVETSFVADVKGWEHRGVERPNTELVLRGPQEGFGELLRVNTALVRKTLKDEDLIVENISIGRRSKTPCSMLYIKDIANDDLVDEVRRRLKSIDVDYIYDSGQLEQMIEDCALVPAPQILATERPDRVATLLTDGKVAVMIHGNPFVLVMPATFPELLTSPEDTYVRFPYGNFLRIIRGIGIAFALLLPGIYVAVTNFHHEMIPTDLILAIAASREKVPFPSVVEILIMELAFELIREAGIRIPGPIGPTLGIVGALILGQAAVAANIVSPILIIVVAVTGIGSFAIPNFALGFAFRILRFGYIFLGAMAGFLGITTGLFLHGLWLVSAKSYGVPFMSPLAPKVRVGGYENLLARAPIWKQEVRPDYLNPKDTRRQPKISRGWVQKKEGEDGNGGKQD
ncbi:MAG: spore germination protein [Clostridia bacterium]|nr:spore germination protein [Clostridia bacterium]